MTAIYVAPNDSTSNLGNRAQRKASRLLPKCPSCGARMNLSQGSADMPPSWTCNRLSACGLVVWFQTARDDEERFFVQCLSPNGRGGWAAVGAFRGPFDTREVAAYRAVQP